MSSTTLHIIQLIKSLPSAEQQTIREALNQQAGGKSRVKGPRFFRRADGSYENPDGIANDDPFFKVMEEIEAARHRTPGRPPPDLD